MISLLRRPTSALTLLLLGLGLPARASAPVAEHAGETLLEPLPSGAPVNVLREDLHLDLTGVDLPGYAPRHRGTRPIHVTARYRLRNDGPPGTLHLTFYAPGLAEGSVRLGDVVVPAASAASAAAGEQGVEDTPRMVRKSQERSYDVALAAGEQTLEVSYDLVPDIVEQKDLLSYAVDVGLGPAQHWASFGAFSMEVDVPDGFDVLDAPSALTVVHGGALLQGSYPSLPAGNIPHTALDAPHVDLSPRPPATLRLHIVPARVTHRLRQFAMYTGYMLGPLAQLWAVAWLFRTLRRDPLASHGTDWVISAASAALLGLGGPLVGLFVIGRADPHLAQPAIYLVPFVGAVASGFLLWILGHLTVALAAYRMRRKLG
jgi:hypothetical protein